jgi:hypothetical protein
MAAKSNSQARVLTQATHNRDDSRKAGKALRDKVPRKSHAVWQASRRRRDPVDILLKSCQGRIPQLIPIRFGRMMQTLPLRFIAARPLSWQQIFPQPRLQEFVCKPAAIAI